MKPTPKPNNKLGMFFTSEEMLHQKAHVKDSCGVQLLYIF